MPSTITLPNTLINTAVADATEVMADLNAIVTRWNADVATVTGDIVGTTAVQTLTNKTLTTPIVSTIYEDAAKTKLMTIPDVASDTFTLNGATQTLSEKTMVKPVINGSVQAFTTDTDDTTITFNMAASNVHTVVLGGNRTLAVSNVVTGQAFVLRLVQDGTGTRTVTWFTTIRWPNAVAPTLTTTLNKIDVFGFVCTGTDTYDGFIIGQSL